MKTKRQLKAVLKARFRVWCFQMYHIICRGQFVWQKEVYEERLPGDRWITTYIGVCKVPKGARWPDDPRITRIAFYNRPLTRDLYVIDEHATQHL
jgi:hypothetical protein